MWSMSYYDDVTKSDIRNYKSEFINNYLISLINSECFSELLKKNLIKWS